MMTRRSIGIGQRLAAGTLGLMLALTLLPRPALAGFQLTSQQQAHITNLTSGVGEALIKGGNSQQDADMAVRAIRAGLQVSYSRGLSDADADKAVAPILDAYITPPGSTRRDPTAQDLAVVKAHGDVYRRILNGRMLPPDADAVVHTVQKVVQDLTVINEDPIDKATAVAGVVAPFKDLPPLTDPESPWHNGPITVANGPAPQPSVSAAPPPLDPTQDIDPDAITVTTDNGTVLISKPNSDGSTTLTVIEEDLSAGQNNNSGNTKNRTGSDDGKKDKDKQNNSGGGNGNNHSGGGHHK